MPTSTRECGTCHVVPQRDRLRLSLLRRAPGGIRRSAGPRQIVLSAELGLGLSSVDGQQTTISSRNPTIPATTAIVAQPWVSIAVWKR